MGGEGKRGWVGERAIMGLCCTEADDGVANKGGAILAAHVEDCRLYSLTNYRDMYIHSSRTGPAFSLWPYYYSVRVGL